MLRTAGLDADEATTARLQGYLDRNPRGRDGRIVYDLRADFGLEPDALYERYAPYFAAFPQIQREVR